MLSEGGGKKFLQSDANHILANQLLELTRELNHLSPVLQQVAGKTFVIITTLAINYIWFDLFHTGEKMESTVGKSEQTVEKLYSTPSTFTEAPTSIKN